MRPAPRRRVLITDGDSRAALAATRSLAREGHVVIVAESRRRSLAGMSRYAAATIEYPDPARAPESFVAAIAKQIRAHAVEVALPMTEITTLLLAERRGSLPEGCFLALPQTESLRRASDKSQVVEIARRLGVPIPDTVTCTSAAQARGIAESLCYPTVFKPARSRIEFEGGYRSTRVQYAHDSVGLARLADGLEPAGWPALLQERIAGPGVGIFACYDRGRPVAFFAHRRIREKPPSGGVSVLRESVAPDPIAIEHSRRLLDHFAWHGVAMVEFKRDLRDGSLRLMEINGRFWGSLQLAIDAGVDFPALALAVACGDEVAPVAGYASGVQSRWFLGDLDVLLRVLTRPRHTLDLPAEFPSRLGLLREFLCGGSGERRSEVLRLDDPMPGLLELWRWLLGR